MPSDVTHLVVSRAPESGEQSIHKWERHHHARSKTSRGVLPPPDCHRRISRLRRRLPPGVDSCESVWACTSAGASSAHGQLSLTGSKSIALGLHSYQGTLRTLVRKTHYEILCKFWNSSGRQSIESAEAVVDWQCDSCC